MFLLPTSNLLKSAVRFRAGVGRSGRWTPRESSLSAGARPETVIWIVPRHI